MSGQIIGPIGVLPTGGGGTAIVVDATGTFGQSISSTTSLDLVNITVGAGLTHSALILTLGFDNQSVTGVTAVWDNGGTNQSMTQIGSNVLTPTGVGLSQIWGLINPIAGNKTLHIAWTTACQAVGDGISFQNVLQTGGSSSFVSFTNSGTSAGTVTLTGTTNDYTVASWTDGAGVTFTALSDNTLYRDNSATIIDFAANYAPQTGSKTLTATTSGAWAVAAVNIVAG